MLPTGHIAAGYLTAYAAIKILKPDLDQHQVNQLLMMGAFWGFAPDIDEFWFFFKNKSLLVNPVGVKKYHHDYFTHAPVVWLVAGLAVYLVSSSDYTKFFGLVLWLASWSHFLLDSIEYGIMWLWPLSNKLYALKGGGEKPFVIEEKNFFKHSLKFVYLYATTSISFYLEVLIIIASLIVFFK